MCAVDETGKPIREGTTLAAPPSIVQYLEPCDDVASRRRTGWFKPVHDRLHRLILKAVRSDPGMSAPDDDAANRLGLCVDLPLHCGRSQAISAFAIRGSYLGLTPPPYQSGEIDWVGRLTKVGDGETRAALLEVASVVSGYQPDDLR